MSKNDENVPSAAPSAASTRTRWPRSSPGPGAYICDECVQLCMSILDDDMLTRQKSRWPSRHAGDHLPTPRGDPGDTWTSMSSARTTAKMALSVAVYNHYKRIYFGGGEDVELQKSNILLLGPTGMRQDPVRPDPGHGS